MTAADRIDRQLAKLLVVNGAGAISHLPRVALASLFQPDDLVVGNDAATLPASLSEVHRSSGEPIEVRLAGWVSFRDPTRFVAVAFGAGDHRMLTEDRPPPSQLSAGDRLELGPLIASVERLLDHPRLLQISFAGSPASVMRDLVRHGRPIQYGHIPEPLMLWDVWTKIAANPIAFESPSAGFALDWRTLKRGASGGSLSRPSRTRPVYRPQATPPSTGGFPWTNSIVFRRRARRRSTPRGQGQAASSRLGRASSGRSSLPPTPTGPCLREKAEQPDASPVERCSTWSMRS
jgi:Queuosine biosynthesis protein